MTIITFTNNTFLLQSFYPSHNHGDNHMHILFFYIKNTTYSLGLTEGKGYD